MRSLTTGAWLVSSLSVALLAPRVAVAQSTPAPVLNSVEVRQLVARAEPADNARLAAHFTALADRYAADAEKHTTMGRGFTGNPNRSLATDMPLHCRRLAALSRETADLLRELAAHHQKLAAGTPSTAPAAGARFEAGAGAREPSEAELAALAGKPGTPADHRALEDFYQTLARRYDADAATHVSMAAAYRSNSRLAGAATHCDRLVERLRELARETRSAAAMHAKLAAAIDR